MEAGFVALRVLATDARFSRLLGTWFTGGRLLRYKTAPWAGFRGSRLQ